ncbi:MULTISPECIES: HEAT repeat domain-containing protein [Streptomyces]|uniref:HEAT repeat domain-containing protein n=1 Tax=Streptomyces TaxID=1883 RepID=UPI003692B4DC
MTDRDARLVAAVRAGDLPEVHALLGPGRNPDAVDAHGLPVLCTAVGALDEEIARALLNAGADPDAADADGTPVLCTAVAAFADGIVQALVEAGADPDQVLPDGTTPLERAVDGGSPATVTALLRSRDLPDPGARLAEPVRERLLTQARHWYETGAEQELRRRTGETGPADIRPAEDGHCDVEEITLGGLTVRAGHGAVLTTLEEAFGEAAAVEVLVARAVRRPDVCGVDWAAARGVLAQCSEETWSRLIAMRRHPAPDHRRFVADCLQTRRYFWGLGVSACATYDQAEGDRLLRAWAEEETDGAVLALLLDAVQDAGLPDTEALGLRHAAHPDARVRREAPYLFAHPLTAGATSSLYVLARDPDLQVRAIAGGLLGRGEDGTDRTRGVLLDLLRDPETWVRTTAAGVLAASGDRTPAVVQALVELLDEEEQELRLEGAYGLALRDDPRAEAAYERVGPLGPAYAYDRRARRPGT